jgi:hypothetical protein
MAGMAAALAALTRLEKHDEREIREKLINSS